MTNFLVHVRRSAASNKKTIMTPSVAHLRRLTA